MGNIFLIQMKHISLVNVWKIGTIMLGERNKRKWIVERKS